MKKQQENTIKDIAQALGLAVSTVSRALSDHPHINVDTKKKVKEAAAKLGYKYNAMAASLRNNKSNIIGLIIPRIARFYQSAAITAIQNKLHEFKYNLMICQSNESVELEKELVNALYAARVEGLIVSSTLHTIDFSHFDVFSKSNRPLVFFDRVPLNYPANIIRGEDYEGGYKATLHLLELGCRRIALICGPLTCSIFIHRFNGYRDALKKYNLTVDDNFIFFHDLTVENAIVTCEKLFGKTSVPDAVFACNDTTAIAVLQYARQLEIDIPLKLKVVGYSNDPLSQVVEPPLSSIEQYPHEVGVQAAIMMMNLIRHKNQQKEFMSMRVANDLVTRKSSAATPPASAKKQMGKIKKDIQARPGLKNPLL